MPESKQDDLLFATSFALALPDRVNEGVINHIQISVFQDKLEGSYRVFFDVVDPSKVKLAEPDEVSKSDNVKER